MERFSRRENIHSRCNLQNQISSTNPSTPNRNSDVVDFHDVFGGPPKRSSIQEMWYAVRELHDSSGVGRHDDYEESAPSCARPRVTEKPVFGEENVSWRRYPSNGFFDDIFGGDESKSCTPRARRHERDPFSASSAFSPARPRPPTTEPFRTSSLPASFSQAGQDKKGIKSELRPSYGQSLLSQNKADTEINLEQHSSTCEIAPGNGQFHFSIYKWANKGVPSAMPLRAERNSRTKGRVKIERCYGAKKHMVSENTIKNDTLLPYGWSSLMKSRKQEDESTSLSTQNGVSIKGTALAKRQSETLSSLQNVVKEVPSNVMPRKSSTQSLSEIGLSVKTKDEPIHANETHKPVLKPLHSLFSESDDKQDYDEMDTSHRGKESKVKSFSELNEQIAMNQKKREETTVAVNGVETSEATSQVSLSMDYNVGNGFIEGKVKEFIRIFNQEPLAKPGIDNKSRIQGSEYKQRGVSRTKNGTTEKVEDYPKQSKKNSGMGTTGKSGNNWYGQDDVPASAVPCSSDKDGSFHGNFLIRELAQTQNEVLQIQNNQEIQVIDAKIRQWSNGKEGNIRSLLSTLQYVLWPESGWKPVPLIDIIEGNAVKRTYQRALLYLHPNKLQQKGAASHKKYMAEKVYNILQEAWTHFTLLDAF